MNFTVRKREIKCTNAKLPYHIGDNADYEAVFTFDDEWNGHIKTARFIQNGKVAEQILADDKCIIPVEVLKKGYMKIGVYTDAMTSTSCEVYIRESIKEKTGVTAQPTPDVYAQIIEMIEGLGGAGGSGSGVVWTEDSVILLKDILYSCADENGKAKVDALASELLPDYVPEEPEEPIGPDEPVVPDEPIVPEEPIAPEVPQAGTWQLKTTTPKKYVIVATDDDNQGNAKFFRMLRTYGFPYTMNVEAEKINADLGTDIDTAIFTDADAPSIFGDGATVKDLGKYIYDNNLGEVAQHGSSANTLWDSENLTGSEWTTLYASYTSQGGTKTEEELKAAIAEAMASTDGSQDAPYVEASRSILEDAFGFPVLTVGAWGGSPKCTIDGIELNLNSFKGTSNYDWRKHNYFGVSSYVADFHINTNPYDISRMNDGPSEILKYVDMLPYGKVVEFFWHMPFHDNPVADYRTLFDSMKQMQSEGKIDVVTRYQYSQLGEYVDNPIESIKVTRTGSLNVGDTDSDSAYTVSVTYADGTTGSPASDMILDRSNVNAEESGTYEVYAYYRGFVATCNVMVAGEGNTLPDGLKDAGYWFVYKNENNGNMYCGNYSKGIVEAKKSSSTGTLVFTASEASGKLNGWKSTDDGATWEQVTTNKTVYNTNLVTNKTSDTDGGYQFNSQYNDKISWVETSGNFDLNY